MANVVLLLEPRGNRRKRLKETEEREETEETTKRHNQEIYAGLHPGIDKNLNQNNTIQSS